LFESYKILVHTF